jgi:hypothetical protein
MHVTFKMARFEEGGGQKNRPRVARVVFNVVVLLIQVILSIKVSNSYCRVILSLLLLSM